MDNQTGVTYTERSANEWFDEFVPNIDWVTVGTYPPFNGEPLTSDWSDYTNHIDARLELDMNGIWLCSSGHRIKIDDWGTCGYNPNLYQYVEKPAHISKDELKESVKAFFKNSENIRVNTYPYAVISNVEISDDPDIQDETNGEIDEFIKSFSSQYK